MTNSTQASGIMVKKFGGTSVGTVERIEAIADRIIADQKNGEKPVVVVSAMAGETNRLVSLANQIDAYHRGSSYDMLVSSGEQISVALLTMALEKRGAKAQGLLAFQLGIQTDAIHSKARIKNIKTDLLKRLIDRETIPVIAGFQGIDDEDNITTLGRGGSDTTAVAVAAALGCRACEIYTDVEHVFTADPRLVPKVRKLEKIAFEEMLEMASLGSKVLQTRSVEIAAKYNVAIHLRSSFSKTIGTWVIAEGDVMEHVLVTGVTHDAKTVICELSSLPKGTQGMAQIFSRLAEREIVVDIISQSISPDGAQRLAFSIGEDDMLPAERILNDTFGSDAFRFHTGLAKLSVVGVGMRNHPGVAAEFFTALAQEDIPVKLVTTSEIKISAVIDNKYLEKAAAVVHSKFNLDCENN